MQMSLWARGIRRAPSRTDTNASISPNQPPRRTAAVIVIVVLVLASAMFSDGRPAAVILQLLAGAGLIGTELVRRISSSQQG